MPSFCPNAGSIEYGAGTPGVSAGGMTYVSVDDVNADLTSIITDQPFLYTEIGNNNSPGAYPNPGDPTNRLGFDPSAFW